jgi:hypothetical protein
MVIMHDEPGHAEGAAAPTATDRRNSPREPGWTSVVLRPAGQPGAFYGNAWVENVSAGGLRLRLDYPVVAGAVLALSLFAPHQPPELRVRVVYAAHVEGAWRAGCAFVPPVGDHL